VLAFVHFDASSVGVAEVRFLADASGSAFAFQAFSGDLRFAVDQEWQRGVATGQAVQLFSAWAEDLAVAGALTLMLGGRCEQGNVDWARFRSAVGGSHADTVFVFQVAGFAEASDDAVLGADGAGMGVGAGRRASRAAGVEFLVFTALLDWGQHHERHWRAFLSNDAAAVGTIAEVSWLAGAAGFADAWAERVGIIAGAIAALALTEFFVVAARFGWVQSDERGWRHWVDLGALLSHDAAAIGSSAEVSLFAGAAGDADSRADRVGFIAGAVAALALTVFFVIPAHFGWHCHGLGGWDTAGCRRDADAVFVLQVAGFAEASDDALQSAGLGLVRVGAGRGAGGAAWHEKFVFFALRDFRGVGEERRGFGGSFALVGRHAEAARVSQMSLFAEACDDAVLGADWARVGVLAVWGASGAAGLEFFIVGALRELTVRWELHGDVMVGLGVAFLRAHAFTVGVFQESLLTETPHDALIGANFVRCRMGAIRYASGSAGHELCVFTAFLIRKSRDGDSEPEGANAEQQRESKARVHR
jgi:hypothetical protein